MSVEVRFLRIGYPGGFELAVDAAEFESRKVTAIVGPNGAGKSTLLRCLGGILPLPKGVVAVDGHDLASLKRRERARRICYVPQELVPALNYTVLDVVLMGRASYVPAFSVPSGEDRATALEMIRYVGLGGFEDREISGLSSGERRLAVMARTLAQDSEIMLLDEPTTFLDPRHEVELMDLCRRLADTKGRTIIAALHNLDLALRSADIMVFLKAGHILASGRPGEIVDGDLLRRVYDLPMSIASFEGKKIVVR